ncbi:heterokaryon incompatibility protein-domain-containing protein [Coniochaeta sp. 2T2.1]|nr:heterokaryon incompatibility protein-domain-containing protein [Coniochaeta sp. 2T2.1]
MKPFETGNGKPFFVELLDETCPLCIFAVNAAQYGSRSRGTRPRPWNESLGSLWLRVQGPLPGFHNGRYPVALLTAPQNSRAVAGSLYGCYGIRVPSKVLDFSTIGSWISDCCNDHNCGRTKQWPNPLGFRLVDCQTMRTVSGDQVGPADFVTLSYVWGKPQDDREDSKSFREWMLDCSLPKDVPRVITDAITVVTGLGYRFLWVDRYCIPQSKHDRDSIRAFEENISAMGAIYAASTFTIIGAAGNGPDDGLAGLSLRRIPQPAITLSGRQIVGITTPAKAILESVWDTRGWTFQEAMLSTRRLVFTEHQIYFQCHKAQYVESLSGAIPFDIEILTEAVFPLLLNRLSSSEDGSDLSRDSTPEPITTWLPGNMVKAFAYIAKYAPRMFTYSHDAYDAFRGIVQLFKAQDPPLHFLLGLPIITPLPPSMVEADHFDSDDSGEGDSQSRGRKDIQEPESELKELALALSWLPADSVGGWTPTMIYISGEAPKSMTRRPQFPSWTWLGWKNFPRNFEYHVFHEKTGRGYSGYMTNRTYHLDAASVHFEGEQPTPWGSGWRDVCDNAETMKIDCLTVTGWLLELSIDVNRWVREGRPTSLYLPSAFRPRDWELDPEEASRECLLDIFDGREVDWDRTFGRETTHRFTAVLLTSIQSRYVPWGVARTQCALFGLLLLEELPEPNTYERFDFITMPAPHDFEQVDEGIARIGPLSLRHTTIRLK